jgi:hypothetical protein
MARNSESDSTHNMAAAMLKGNAMMGAGAGAFAANGAVPGMSFPPLPRVDSMLLQSQYGQQQSQQQHGQSPTMPQQQLHQQQMMANYVSSMSGMSGVTGDLQGAMQGAFPLGYSSMMQGNGMFNQADPSLQAHQMLPQQQTSAAYMAGGNVGGVGAGLKSVQSQSSGSGGSTISEQQGLYAGAKLFTLPPNGVRQAHMRRNSSSFQHLGMIEGVLDGTDGELRQ